LIPIPSRTFRMGSESPEIIRSDGEAPVRVVQLAAYSISATCVTNAQFAEFADATGHVTDAESFGWSFVFGDFVHPAARDEVVDGRVAGAPWWRGVRGASWRHPHGRGSSLEGLERHPVVHVSWNDAMAFAEWNQVRLPTEAEWEYAARGGLDQCTYPWGDHLTPGGEHRANIWQGSFPGRNSADDGYVMTAPVDAFAPNGLGLFSVAGNVWEWAADWFSADWHTVSSERTRVNPTGPPTGTSKVLRGGSYICHASYCNRYRVSARTHNVPDTSLGHTGFRVAADR